MDANSLLQLILLTIALGALVYCLIQARGARDGVAFENEENKEKGQKIDDVSIKGVP